MIDLTSMIDLALEERTKLERHPHQLAMRDDVLRAAQYYITEHPGLAWERILGGVVEALALIQAAAHVQGEDRAKAAELLRHSIEADQ